MDAEYLMFKRDQEDPVIPSSKMPTKALLTPKNQPYPLPLLEAIAKCITTIYLTGAHIKYLR